VTSENGPIYYVLSSDMTPDKLEKNTEKISMAPAQGCECSLGRSRRARSDSSDDATRAATDGRVARESQDTQ